MAGIIATSLTTNNSADTAPDKTVTGYIVGEAITLTTTPTGASYAWTISKPSGSQRASLTSDTVAAPVFTPDIDGYYVLTCTVGGVTVYVLRINVLDVGNIEVIDGVRMSPIEDAQVPTPPAGVTFFFSSTQDGLAIKDTNGDVFTVDVTAV